MEQRRRYIMKELETVEKWEVQNNIHSESSIRFAEDIIGYRGKELNMLKEGIKIEAKISPGERYEEDNNRSCKENIEEVRRQLKKWLQEGKVIELEHKPRIVNPLSVVVKKDGKTDKIKYRVVIDQSRFVNKRIEKSKTKLEGLQVIEKSLETNDFMTSFDLTDMYHQVRLEDTTTNLYGTRRRQ